MCDFANRCGLTHLLWTDLDYHTDLSLEERKAIRRGFDENSGLRKLYSSPCCSVSRLIIDIYFLEIREPSLHLHIPNSDFVASVKGFVKGPNGTAAMPTKIARTNTILFRKGGRFLRVMKLLGDLAEVQK